MQTVWKKGIPKDYGIYWFDSGMRLFDRDKRPFILKVGHSNYIFGDFGSFPLEHIIPNMKYAAIVSPEKWETGECITKQESRAWIKHPQGHLGIGLLRPGSHFDVGGTIVWLNHPTLYSEHGSWYRYNAGYLYSPLEEPKLGNI